MTSRGQVVPWAPIVTGVAASLPIIAAAVYAVVDRWIPIGDDAYIAVHAFDVLSSRFPLVGQWSAGASQAVGEVVYSPGPLHFWVLALPARSPEPSLLAVTAGLVNVASVVGVVALARRRGGPALMFATAVGVAVMLASLPAETYSDVWNPSTPLLPLALLVFLAWSVASGELRLLPLTVLMASFLAHAHLAVVAPALAVTGVAVVATVPRLLPGRGTAPDGSSPRRMVAAAAVVLLVCWAPPLVDQATNSPGNLELLARSASSDDPTLGWDAGRRAIIHTVGVPPWWLRPPRDPLERIGDLTRPVGAVAGATAIVVVVALAVVVLAGLRRRRADVCAAGALGLVLTAAAGVNTASTPEVSLAATGYVLRWTSPAGMCVWLLLGWAVATLVAGARGELPMWRSKRTAVAGVAVTGVVAALVAVVANPPPKEPFAAMRTVADRLDARLASERPTRVDAVGDLYLSAQFQAGVVYWLRRHGTPVTAPQLDDGLGPDYVGDGYEQVVTVAVDLPRGDRGQTIADVAFSEPSGERREHTLTVSVAPG